MPEIERIFDKSVFMFFQLKFFVFSIISAKIKNFLMRKIYVILQGFGNKKALV